MSYIVQMDCGDYYCGCGGGHVVGVYNGEVDAHLALKQALEMRHGFDERSERVPGGDHKTWMDGRVIDVPEDQEPFIGEPRVVPPLPTRLPTEGSDAA